MGSSEKYITEKQLEVALSKYIKDGHTQEECIGFISGFEAAQNIDLNFKI